MAYEFKTTRRVEFSDTDMAGIVHFANFFRFIEAAEHEFYRSIGFSVHEHQGELIQSWPRLETRCTYLKPLRFDDLVETHLMIEEIRNKTISYKIVMRKVEDGQSTVVAKAGLVVICIERDPRGEMKSIPIPDDVRKKIEVAPKDLLEKED
jgi:YbgC/YbaW family acyl-CoA thioester hydrolase